MRDPEIWRRELISEIRTIASPEEIAKLWSGKHPRHVSSFAEEVAHVFDDYDIDGFLAQDARRPMLSPLQHAALRAFRDQFSEFIETIGQSPTADRVLKHPGWGKVVGEAQRFIRQVDGPTTST